MSDELKHECAVAMVVLRRPPSSGRAACPQAAAAREDARPPVDAAAGTEPGPPIAPAGKAPYQTDFGGTKLSLLLEKQHNRGQDGAGAAVLFANPEPGEAPYWIAKSASSTPLVDILGAIARRNPSFRRKERVFLGHLRYATFGKNDVAFCHPFVHESSDLAHTLLLAGNFNLTNAHELFVDYSRHGSFPTSKADGYLICELIAHELGGRMSSSAAAREDARPPVYAAAREDARPPIADAISKALANADGAWTLCGMTGDGWAFATRDPHGIRPGFYYIDDEVVVVASERPAIQAAFDIPPDAVKELPPGEALVISPDGKIMFECLSCECSGSSATSNLQTFKPSNLQTFKPSNFTPQTSNIKHQTSNIKLQTSNPQTLKHSNPSPLPRPCSFERIYFSRANDADIHRERKALGAALLPSILKAADAPLDDIFFSYIPNSARIAFHGLLEELFKRCSLTQSRRAAENAESASIQCFEQAAQPSAHSASQRLCVNSIPRFGEIAVKDAKFRTFIADAAARREFYKHVYDVTYGLVRPGKDTLVVLDDSIVRGNTMKNAILPMLDRLGPKRIVIASSAPPIRYPDCYGIDMSTLGELVAFRALVNLLNREQGTGNWEQGIGNRESGTGNAELVFREALAKSLHGSTCSTRPDNPLAELYARFTEEEHCAEIARLLTPPDMKAEVKVVYQTVEDLRRCLTSGPEQKPSESNLQPTTHNSQLAIGDWYFTGEYPTPGGYKVLHTALQHYIEKSNERSY